jgi:hypothetical protein
MIKLLLFIALFALSCEGKQIEGGGSTGPPPPTYDHEEQEPNDELNFPQFLDLLPTSNQQDLIGSFSLPQDTDCYGFFLFPAVGGTSVWFNFMLECDPFINPKVRLWQSVVDAQGIPTGHQLLGTWVADDGLLVVVDEEIPYDSFFNNDLIMQILPWGGLADPPPNIDLTYSLDFWSS